MFQAFYQGGTGVSRRKGHAGLGLYIAKTIVDKHGGEIAASRGEDGGAVVTVTLPMGEGR
ncbi:Sensor histidine kinase YycG [compost metagenome]